MKRLFRTSFLLASLGICCPASADTYKCSVGGKIVYADAPCQSSGSRVDQQADAVSRDQQRQAEIVNTRNRRQLAELEYSAARDRHLRGSVSVIDSMQSPDTANSRYGRR